MERVGRRVGAKCRSLAQTASTGRGPGVERIGHGFVSGGMNEPTRGDDLDLNALMQEQRRGWERGEPTPVEALLVRHAALRGQKEALLDLINHEIVLRTEFHQAPSRDEYRARFPDLKTDLDMLFEVHKALEGNSPQDASTIEAKKSSITTSPDWPTLPNYEVLAVLGEGGMGIVYKAMDQRLKRPVALKMIRTGLAGRKPDAGSRQR